MDWLLPLTWTTSGAEIPREEVFSPRLTRFEDRTAHGRRRISTGRNWSAWRVEKACVAVSASGSRKSGGRQRVWRGGRRSRGMPQRGATTRGSWREAAARRDSGAGRGEEGGKNESDRMVSMKREENEGRPSGNASSKERPPFLPRTSRSPVSDSLGWACVFFFSSAGLRCRSLSRI